MARLPFRPTAHDVGLALLVPAALALTGLAVALVAGEPAAALGFGIAAVAGGGLGGALTYGLRAHRRHSTFLGQSGNPKPVVALGWLGASVIAAIPFFVAALAGADAAYPSASVFADPINALFESMSGLTSTGLTVVPDASRLPRALQWWRSILQWVGGIGILYFALALAADKPDRSRGEELEEEMRAPGSASHLATIWAIYAGYTVASILAFYAAGMPLWEAVNHGLTGIATGGFTITGDSFVPYGRAVHLVAGVVILLGAISFGVHYAVLLRGQFGHLRRDVQVRMMAALLVAGTLALALVTSPGDLPFADVTFQWASALFTAGFYTTDVAPWGAVPLALLVVGMFIGGASGSTAGGLKQRRAARLLNGLVRRSGRVRFRPALRQLVRMSTALALGTALLVALGGVAWLDALFEATSALGTVGLSVGVTSADLPAGGRLVLTALMWVGRLEVAAVLAVFVRPRSES